MGMYASLALLAGGFLLVKGAVDSVKRAGDFQTGLTQLVTGAGEHESNLSLVSAGILKISSDTATSTKSLEDAMYLIDSSGQRGSQSLATLRAVAQGAKVDNADLADTANGVTTAMTDYAKSGLTAVQATNDLIATTSSGKVHMGDLAASLANILPYSSKFGVSLADTTAALATMTAGGVPADQAATFLRQTLITLAAPSAGAAKALKEVGLSAQQVSDQMKVSLPATLEMIIDHLKNKFPEGSVAYTEALKAIAGGSKQLSGILDLTGTSMQTFKNNALNIADATNKGGTSVKNWTLVQKDFNFTLDQMHTNFDNILTKVGLEVLPMFQSFITGTVLPLINDFQQWATNTTGLHDAFQTVVDVAGTLITDTQAIVSWFGQAGPQGTILKDVLLAIGVALTTIKMLDLINNLKTLTTTNLTQLGFLKDDIKAVGTETKTSAETVTTETAVMDADFKGVGVAAVTSAGEEGIGAIGPAAEKAAVAVADQAGIMKTALAGVGIGLAAFGLSGMVQDQYHIGPNSDIAKAAKEGKTLDQIHQEEQAAKDAAAALAQNNKDIQQGYDDMAALYDEYHAFAGYDPGSTLPFFNTFIVNVDQAKSHLDDLSNAVYLDGSLKPTIIGTLTPAIEEARLNTIEYKSTLDDTAYNAVDDFNKMSGNIIGVLSPAIVAARQHVIDVKSSADDTKGPFTPTFNTSSIDDAKQHTDDLKNGLYATNGPFTPTFGLRSVDDATLKVMNFKTQLDDLSNGTHYINVTTVYADSGAKPVVPTAAHASGGFGLPSGWSTTGEFGTELVNVPSGANIMPHNSFASIMDSIPLLGKAVSSLVSQQHSGNTSGGSGSGGITINGDVHLHGVQNVQQLWQELNEYGGLGHEYGGRGAIVGH